MDARLTLQEVMARTRLSEDTIHREIRRRNLRGEKLCGRWRFRETQVLIWLSGLKTRSGSRREVQSRAA